MFQQCHSTTYVRWKRSAEKLAEQLVKHLEHSIFSHQIKSFAGKGTTPKRGLSSLEWPGKKLLFQRFSSEREWVHRFILFIRLMHCYKFSSNPNVVPPTCKVLAWRRHKRGHADSKGETAILLLTMCIALDVVCVQWFSLFRSLSFSLSFSLSLSLSLSFFLSLSQSRRKFYIALKPFC